MRSSSKQLKATGNYSCCLCRGNAAELHQTNLQIDNLVTFLLTMASGSSSTPSKRQREASCDEDPENDQLSDEEGGYLFDDIYIPSVSQPVRILNTIGPRLIVTSIENENFKSYAGRQVLGPFHKCFNAIMGPNGSGKSNVIDALLFVFGYRASRLRSKKVSVMLHNSDGHHDVRSCTVTVNFVQIIDKDDDFEIVPNSNIAISRTAFRDNSSFYTLNGRRVQFKMIARLLRSHSVDLDFNRFLILQGEVEQIAMMKPKGSTENDVGMLEFLEDIIGSSRYRKPIEKLNDRVDKLIAERSEKVNRVKYAEKEKVRLEGPRNEAINYIKMENQIAEKKNIMFQKFEMEYSKDIVSLTEKQELLESDMKQLKRNNKEIQERRCAIEDEIAKMTRERAKVNERKDKVSEILAESNAKDIHNLARINALKKATRKTQSLLEEEKNKLVSLEYLPTKTEKDITELIEHEARLCKKRDKEKENVEKAMVKIRQDTVNLQEKKEKMQTELLILQKVVNETKSAYDIAQSTLNLYTSSEQQEKNKLEEMNNHLQNICAMVSQRKEALENLKVKIPESTKLLKRAERELADICTQQVQLGNELHSIHMKLEEIRVAAATSHFQNRVIGSLMRERQYGRLPGLFGRLGDLGAIDKKYDVAISTACGCLDNIVVDTVDTGQKCIEFLKRNNIGRTSIIVLEKQEHLKNIYHVPFHAPGASQRLFNLIRVEDERVRPAFYFALRDTLVASDLKQASEVAYGKRRYRVVTLDGQIIEPSGTMSGGGHSRRHGRMGQQIIKLSSPQEKNNLEVKMVKVDSTMAELRELRSRLEQEVEMLSTQVNKMQMEFNKFNVELKTMEEQVPVLRQQLKQQEDKTTEARANASQVSKLTATRDIAYEAFKEAVEKADRVDTQVKQAHAQLLEITGCRTKAVCKQLNEMIKQIEKVQRERTRLTVCIRSNKRNCDKSKEKISHMETEVKELTENLEKLHGQKKTGFKELDSLRNEIDTLTETLQDMEDMLKKLTSRLKDELQHEMDAKRKMAEKDHEIDAISINLQNCKAHLKGIRSKRKLLQLQLVPDEAPPKGLPSLTADALDVVSKEELSYDICILESKLSQKRPNLAVLDEYKEKEQIYVNRVAELEEATNKRNHARSILEDIRKRRLTDFMDGYTIITMKLKEMYQTITLGGDADFELVDTLDPFSEGIIFSVRPPKKSWKNISNLSGGEKTLASLALVFALHYYKPSPLYIMDEIDAALDFRNVSIIGNYIKERTKNAQFIIVSLRANMFELADRLIGIYKTYNCTKSVTINPRVYNNTI